MSLGKTYSTRDSGDITIIHNNLDCTKFVVYIQNKLNKPSYVHFDLV